MTTCVTRPTTTLALPPPVTGTPRSAAEMACLGQGLTLDQLTTVWSNPSAIPAAPPQGCNVLFNQIIYGSPGTRQYNPLGFRQVMDNFNYLFSAYFNTDGSTVGGHDFMIGQPFQAILVDACTNPQYQNQGACQLATEHFCGACQRADLTSATGALGSDLLRLCGCVVPSLNPQQYPGITRPCDPLCNQGLVAKPRDVPSGTVAECTTGVCVINNVSIQAAQSTVGGISFTQVCPQCINGGTGGGCKCVVDAAIVNAANGLPAIGINDPIAFTQVCGADAICLVVNNETQQTSQVPCSSVIKPVEPVVRLPIPWWIWLVVGLVVVVFALVLLAIWYDVLKPAALPTSVATTSTNGSDRSWLPSTTSQSSGI